MDPSAAIALRDAAVEGNIEEVTRIITSGEHPVNGDIGDATRPSGMYNDPTILTVAAEFGNKKLLLKTLELGGDLYTVGEKERPDCWAAHISGDYFGAMVTAATVSHFDIVSSLAEYRLFKLHLFKLHNNSTEADNDHPLSPYSDFVTSAKEGDFDKLESLLSSLEDKCKSTSTSMLAGWKGHNLMSLFLLHQCPSWCIQTLIHHGIGVNGWDFNGLTPLMCAILSGKLENVQFLIDKGADVYAPFLKGSQFFRADGMVINERGEIPTSSSICDEYYSSNLVGPTALMISASLPNILILKLMLQMAPNHIVPLEECYLSTLTPLTYAVHYGNLESVSLILSYEAARNNPSDEPFKSAIRMRKTDVYELLLERTTNHDLWNIVSAGLCAITNDCPQYLTKFLEFFEKEFDQLDDEYGWSMMFAIDANANLCADILFNRPGFNIDKRWGYREQTGLMYACWRGKHEFVPLLIKMGAKIDLRDNEGKTAAMLAACNINETANKCLDILIDAQADLDIVHNEGGTVFSEAMCCIDEHNMELLVKSGRILVGNELKLVHKKSLKNYFPSIRNIILSIKLGLFDWEWCSLMPRCLNRIAFAVVTSGVSPGTFQYQDYQLSLLLFAFIKQDVATVRYLLANLYFLPGDYQFLLNDVAMKQLMTFSYPSELSFLVESITCRLLPLESLTFLTISNALSSSAGLFSNQRGPKVDSLPLPVKMREYLKFKSNVSYLCMKHWKHLGIQMDDNDQDKQLLDYLVMFGRGLANAPMKKCSVKRCDCNGLGLTFESSSWGNEEKEESFS